MKKILIVDDHRLFADGIRFLIEFSTDYEVVSVLCTGLEVIPFLARNPVNIVLLDISLPDVSGFDLVEHIRHTNPDTKILALSMLGDNRSIDRMLHAGAAGYCIKSAGREELFTAIRQVSNGSVYLPEGYFKQLYQQKSNVNNPSLTERETEILQLIARGGSTNGIAEKLFLSSRTIETHRKNIYRKLGIHTNVELACYAQTHQLT